MYIGNEYKDLCYFRNYKDVVQDAFEQEMQEDLTKDLTKKGKQRKRDNANTITGIVTSMCQARVSP